MEGYVCVLSTDDYLDGVLLLDYNLKVLNSKYPLLCLINENISDDTIKVLDYFNIKHKLVNSITYDNKDNVNRWNNTFDKLNVFNLTEYDKLIYLDTDMLILKNIDNLFEINRFTMVPDIPFNDNTFNSALMIIKPNINTYKELIDLVNLNINNNSTYIGDQTIINDYYKDKNVITLEKKYNAMRALYKYEDKYKSNEVTKEVESPVIVHYISQPKPFMVDDYDDEYSDIYKEYLNIIRERKKNV